MTSYTSTFFHDHRAGALRSAHQIVPLIKNLMRVESVVDLGCGIGAWLAAFREHDVEDILGVDGDYVERDKLEIPAECFLSHDLRQPLNLRRRFDLAVSLEVAEHLPGESAPVLVQSLVDLAPVVLFSAAAPHQSGKNHVNEQWPAYWAEHFAAHDYLPIDCLRRKLWDRDDVEWWYSQNAFLYAEKSHLRANERLLREHEACPKALALVHPRRYLEWVEWGLAQMQLLTDSAAAPPTANQS